MKMNNTTRYCTLYAVYPIRIWGIRGCGWKLVVLIRVSPGPGSQKIKEWNRVASDPLTVK